MDNNNNKLPIDKLLDVQDGQYKVAVASFKRVHQMASSELINIKQDSKKLPVLGLRDVLIGKVKIYEETQTEKIEEDIYSGSDKITFIEAPNNFEMDININMDNLNNENTEDKEINKKEKLSQQSSEPEIKSETKKRKKKKEITFVEDYGDYEINNDDPIF